MNSSREKVTFVATRRNGRALLFGGYFYHINKSVDERSYWKCRTKGCKSTLVTIKDCISSASGQHFHEPNDSRVDVQQNINTVDVSKRIKTVPQPKLSQTKHSNESLLTLIPATKRQKTSYNLINNNVVQKESKNNNNNNNRNDNELIQHLDYELIQHLDVEIKVDECGKVTFESNESDDYDEFGANEFGANEMIAQSSGSQTPQTLPHHYFGPNNIYFANNLPTFDQFDTDFSNFIKVVRQSGFNSLDVDQLSSHWQIWKKRFCELTKKDKRKSFGSAEKEVENLKLQLEIAVNAKNEAERQCKKMQKSQVEMQNTVTALKLMIRKSLSNGSNNQCVALLNEIQELKRKVCAQVETHQANLNEVKRLLCLDDNELRSEFDQLAKERDEALLQNEQLKKEIERLKNKSTNDKKLS